MTRAELLRLARLGAEARLSELRQEIEAIYSRFPDLRAGRPGAARAAGEPAPPSRENGRRMSDEGRQRIAEAARRRWDAWRRQHQPDAPGAEGAAAAGGDIPRSAKKATRARNAGGARKKTRTMSAEARQRIAEAARKRWAARREAQSTPADAGATRGAADRAPKKR